MHPLSQVVESAWFNLADSKTCQLKARNIDFLLLDYWKLNNWHTIEIYYYIS